MYSSLPHFVLGFHGCDRSVGEDILAGKKPQLPSANKYDWLGHGYYFWENNPARALEYAKEMRSAPNRTRGNINNPFVIGAVIDLGHCLNLLENESLQVLKSAYELLEALAKMSETTLPANKEIAGEPLLRDLDCAVIETLHQYQANEKQKAYDSVRGMFAEGKALYANAGFRERNHIQVCVRNPNCIKGYFRVRSPSDGYPIP